ncbi:VOC family protein [Streptomyces vinaceus]|uniref:VOC family protein n=1 Tax=Streptomyces vinaceus TaxID=1960 RepID=UPI003806A4EA
MTVNPIPEGSHTITPFLCIKDAHKAVEFYKKAFGAIEMLRISSPSGHIGQAELRIGDSTLLIADPTGMEDGLTATQNLATPAIAVRLYVEDCDKVYAQALQAGATETNPVQDQFYGDRSGSLKDPFGNLWFISTHKEDLTLEEIRNRAQALLND